MQCDASGTGLGAFLLQREQPTAYASRALTTEQGYSQIEKELLAVVFAMERFDQYVYGRSVEVRSDHQPLQTISSKALHFAPKRLERILLRLQRYDYIIRCQPGKEILVSYTLSRACGTNSIDNSGSEADDLVVAALQTRFQKQLEQLDATVDITLPPSRLARLKGETAQDETLQALAKLIKIGWSEDKNRIPLDVRAYHNVRDEHTVENGVIFGGQRRVVPSSLRREVIEKLHSAHMGIEACTRRACICVYWTGLNGQIRDYVKACQACQLYAQKQQKESFFSTGVPTRQGSIIAADLFSLAGRHTIHNYYFTY